MAKLPRPPAIDRLRDPAIGSSIRYLPATTRIARIYFRAGAHPTLWHRFRHFGPTAARFDHHEPDAAGHSLLQQRGILYGAGGHTAAGLVCLAEVFQKNRFINRVSGAPWLVVFAATRTLRLLDLSGLWPTRAGASTALASGPRPRARAWSRAIYAAYEEIDGLWYPSLMTGHAPALALYERAQDAVPETPLFNRALADPALDSLVQNAARSLNYRLD